MVNLSESLRGKAEEMCGGIISSLKATSLQYAVRYKGEVVTSGSVGGYDKAGTRPLSNDDMYGVGSVSKVYTAAAAMLLVDRGQLDLDKPFKDYVPEFEMADPRHVDIACRHLLNHSSGIYGTHFKGSFLFEDNNTFAHDNLLENLKVGKLKYAPGTFSEYCNDGFQLMELLVERIGGMPFNEYLKRNFFEPLNIKNTVTPLDSYDFARMARFSMPQVYDGDLPFEITNVIGTGGIVSTAEDLCLFGQVLMGRKILSRASAAMMAQKEYENSAFWPKDEEQDNLFAYGLGFDHVHVPPFDKIGYQALCKGGDTSQYHASLVVIPELDLAAAALSAGGASFANYLLVIELLKGACLEYGIIKEFPPKKTFTAPAKQAMPAELEKYAGHYADNGKFANIEIRDGEIELGALLGGMIPAQKYVYSGDGRFTSPDGKNALHFADVVGGLTFLQGDITIEIPDVGFVKWKAFLYQRLVENKVEADVAAVWAARKGKEYILVDDIYTSGNFLSLSEIAQVELDVDTEYGYAYGGARIVDENYAENVLVFRDVVDLRFHSQDGVEYLFARGDHYVDVAGIPQLEPDVDRVVIDSNGYTKFYTVGGDLEGRMIRVKLPQTGAFGAYSGDKPRQMKTLTTVTGNNTAELKKGDLLAFVGDAGDVFGLELK
jgi:CubicO group peptidase (beta-lactamase class C family)